MRPRFQADADLHGAIVTGILRREPAIDFQAARVIADATPDLAILRLAAREGRILVSHDGFTMPRQFQQFLEEDTGGSPGRLLISQSLDVGRAIEELILLWAASEAEEWSNRITWLPL